MSKFDVTKPKCMYFRADYGSLRFDVIPALSNSKTPNRPTLRNGGRLIGPLEKFNSSTQMLSGWKAGVECFLSMKTLCQKVLPRYLVLVVSLANNAKIRATV